MELLLKQIILAVHHDFQWVLVATKFLTAKLHSLYVKESESEILERSELESESDFYLRLRNPASKTETIFLLQTTRYSLSSEGTNSSLAQSAGELRPLEKIPRLAFVGLEFVPNFCLLSHNSGSRYARKPIKGSKDLDDSLVSKKLEPKNGLLGWRPGPGNLSHKDAKTCPHYDITHKNQKPK